MNENSMNPQCHRCHHYMKNSSCGSCVDEGAELVQNILNSTDFQDNKLLESEEINLLKYACKVVINSPEDFNVVNPLDCKYYLPNALRLA